MSYKSPLPGRNPLSVRPSPQPAFRAGVLCLATRPCLPQHKALWIKPVHSAQVISIFMCARPTSMSCIELKKYFFSLLVATTWLYGCLCTGVVGPLRMACGCCSKSTPDTRACVYLGRWRSSLSWAGPWRLVAPEHWLLAALPGPALRPRSGTRHSEAARQWLLALPRRDTRELLQGDTSVTCDSSDEGLPGDDGLTASLTETSSLQPAICESLYLSVSWQVLSQKIETQVSGWQLCY